MSRFASAPWPLKAAYVAALGAGAASVLTVLTLGIALGGLKRLSPAIDPAEVVGWFWYFRGDAMVQRWLTIGALSSIGIAGVSGLAVLRSIRPALHGAARWAGEGELRQNGLRADRGIILGRKGGRLLTFGGEEHAILYAPTRSGKGVGIVIPNLLAWPDSVVVLDVKRENWDATAGFRSSHGQQVILFDPLDADGRTARYNPLGHIDRTDQISVLDELQKLAVMLFPAPNNSDPFWAEAARTGFIGVGAYIAETAETPFSLGSIYRELTHGDPRTRLPAAVTARTKAGSPLSKGCVNALSDFCSASDNTFASIKQTITSRMNLWLNPRVCAATDVSDFDLRDLRSKPMSLYLGVSPDNLARVAPLYNLLLQQFVDMNTRERVNTTTHPLQVLVILDEFARLGHAAVIAHGFSYVAGYGLRLLPVLQSPAQLRAEYGPDLAEEIMANCGVEVTFAPKELKVAQDLSERLGYWTYAGKSKSRPTLLSSGRRSTTESDQRRALMMPQELIQLPADRLIALRSGMAPILGRKITYWRERVFTKRLLPPPVVKPHAGLGNDHAPPVSTVSEDVAGGLGTDPLTLDLVAPALAAAGLEPLPDQGASDEMIEAWVDRFIDASVQRTPLEVENGR